MASRAKKKWRHRQDGPHHALKEKLALSGITTEEVVMAWDRPGSQKMSRVIRDFVEPFAGQTDSPEEYRTLVAVGLIAWNAALLPDESRNDLLARFFSESLPADVAEGYREVLDRLIERKRTCFATNNRFILGHDWSFAGSQPRLSVVTTEMR